MQRREISNVPPMSRTVSSSSAVSHMDLQIKHHWNDAVVASSLKSRSISPIPPISDSMMQETIQKIIDNPTRLTEAQHRMHAEKIRSLLNLKELSQDDKLDLNSALSQETPEQKRKAIVSFIREHDGVIRWAASLRALAESGIVVDQMS